MAPFEVGRTKRVECAPVLGDYDPLELGLGFNNLPVDDGVRWQDGGLLATGALRKPKSDQKKCREKAH
jgi:hypothetical protein